MRWDAFDDVLVITMDCCRWLLGSLLAFDLFKSAMRSLLHAITLAWIDAVRLIDSWIVPANVPSIQPMFEIHG